MSKTPPIKPGHLVHVMVPGPALATFRPVTAVEPCEDGTGWRVTVAVREADEQTYAVGHDGGCDYLTRPEVHTGWSPDPGITRLYDAGGRHVASLRRSDLTGVAVHIQGRGVDLRIPPAPTGREALAAHGITLRDAR